MIWRKAEFLVAPFCWAVHVVIQILTSPISMEISQERGLERKKKKKKTHSGRSQKTLSINGKKPKIPKKKGNAINRLTERRAKVWTLRNGTHIKSIQVRTIYAIFSPTSHCSPHSMQILSNSQSAKAKAKGRCTLVFIQSELLNVKSLASIIICVDPCVCAFMYAEDACVCVSV